MMARRGVKAIGLTGNDRSPQLPAVPTRVEQGLTGRPVQLEGGLPLVAPACTREAFLKALSQVVGVMLAPHWCTIDAGVAIASTSKHRFAAAAQKIRSTIFREFRRASSRSR